VKLSTTVLLETVISIPKDKFLWEIIKTTRKINMKRMWPKLPLVILGPGDFFGHNELEQGGSRQADAVNIGTTELL